MYLGKFQGRCCVSSKFSPNESVCITGLSGSGKTVRLQRIEIEAAREGNAVIVLDLNQTHLHNQIFSGNREEFLQFENRIDAVRDGLNISLLLPSQTINGETESFVNRVNSAVNAFSSSQNMGVRQLGVLRTAVIQAVNQRSFFQSDADAIKYALLCQGDAHADAVYEKLWTILNCGVLRPSEKALKNGAINIIDLCGVDMITRKSLAEIVLSALWQIVQHAVLNGVMQPVVLVLDECQIYNWRRTSVLCDILREGRKFKLKAVLATQTLDCFSSEIISLLDQTATKLYFRPPECDTKKIARKLGKNDSKRWEQELSALRVGESIAVGDFNVNGQEIRRPILLT